MGRFTDYRTFKTALGGRLLQGRLDGFLRLRGGVELAHVASSFLS